MRLTFITHPEVAIDPAVPVPRWRLNEKGTARMRAFADGPVLDGTAEVWASSEAKAIEGAGIVAARFGLPVRVDEALGENDRSATGYLPPPEFEATADAFFASPDESVRGWERAIDAQARVVGAVERIMGQAVGNVAIVAHGAVGALLLCRLMDVAISRTHDQPGAGSYYVVEGGRLLHGWRAI